MNTHRPTKGYVNRTKLIRSQQATAMAREETRLLKRRLKLMEEYLEAMERLRFHPQQLPKPMARVRALKNQLEETK